MQFLPSPTVSDQFYSECRSDTHNFDLTHRCFQFQDAQAGFQPRFCLLADWDERLHQDDVFLSMPALFDRRSDR